jgi:hypothetical protein
VENLIGLHLHGLKIRYHEDNNNNNNNNNNIDTTNVEPEMYDYLEPLE